MNLHIKFAYILLFSACCQHLQAGVTGSPVYGEVARLIVYREKSDHLKKRGFPLQVNGVAAATMWNASRFEMMLPPGPAELLLNTDPPVQVGLRLLPGQQYFLRVFVTEDSSGMIPGMALVKEPEARDYLESNRLRNLGTYDPVRDSLNRIKTWLHWSAPDGFCLGAQLGFGPGFQGLEMVTLANGKPSKLSAGGGGHFALTAAYRFTRNIEVQAEAGVQSGGLTPTVSNAEASFSRFVLAFAARFSLPFANNFRFNIGPGIMSCLEPTLDADLSKLQNGYKASFRYKPSQGYYGIAELEYFFKSWAAGVGVQYQYHEYTLTSAMVDGYRIPINNPGLDPFRHMNGSGMFVLWNLKYFL